MADKRITKTKRNIKNTVIKLLSNTQFEKITVSELCRIGEISRITFYTYYNDIYDLIDEMFSDYIEEAIEDYHKLQSKNNQLNEPMSSGLWGVINECYSSKKSQSIIRKNIKSIYQDILTSSIFIRS